MQSNQQWIEKMASQIGRGIDAAREKRSDQWIADRTAHLGHPISRTAISEYRRGKRKSMPVTDLMVISAALGVPPVTILFPGLPDTPVAFLPVVGEPVALDALLWFTGERQTLPDGVDVMISLEDGEIAGHVEGKREYRTNIEYTGGGPYDLRFPESEAGPAKQLLDACRELVSAFGDYHRIEIAPFMVFEDNLSSEQRTAHLKAHMQLVQDLDAQIKELEARITALGGVIQEETHHSYDEAEADGEG